MNPPPTDSTLSMQGAWVWSPVRELRSHMLCGMAKKKKKKKDKHFIVHRCYCENLGQNKGLERKRLPAFTLNIYKTASLLPPFYNQVILPSNFVLIKAVPEYNSAIYGVAQSWTRLKRLSSGSNTKLPRFSDPRYSHPWSRNTTVLRSDQRTDKDCSRVLKHKSHSCV